MENIKTQTVKFPYLDEPITIYERENGHKIVLAKKQGGLVNISTWIETGSINENAENNGVSHFLEHLMFKGTPSHVAGEFDRLLESKGAIINAATWKDYTFYYITIPKGLGDKDFYEAIELHADMMLHPLLPEDEIGEPFEVGSPAPKIKRERHVVIEEIRMRQDQPWTKAYNQLNNAMYLHHPYKRDVIGTPEIIAGISRESIKNYYDTHYTPNNMTTIVVGEFDDQTVLDKVIKEFDFDSRKNMPKENLKLEDLPNKTKYVEAQAKFNTSFMMFGYLGPVANNMKETIALDIVSLVLGEGTSSRLYQNLIEKTKEPIFNMLSTEHYHFKDGSNFFVQANFKTDKKDEAIEAIKLEIEKMVNEEITQKELNKAKKKLKSTFAVSSETVSEIADTIGFYATTLQDIKSVENYLTELNSITKEDIQNTAKKYLTLDKATISVILGE